MFNSSVIKGLHCSEVHASRDRGLGGIAACPTKHAVCSCFRVDVGDVESSRSVFGDERALGSNG